MKMRIFSVGISVIDDHFRIITANLRLDEIAHQKYPHPHCNNMKEMGNFLAADLENFLRQHRTIPALRLKHRSGICRTSLAVSALRIMRYCPWFFIQTGKRFVPRALTSLFRGELSLNFKAIPHNSKCRYGERGAAAARPKAQIILCVLSSILATQMPCRSRQSGA